MTEQLLPVRIPVNPTDDSHIDFDIIGGYHQKHRITVIAAAIIVQRNGRTGFPTRLLFFPQTFHIHLIPLGHFNDNVG